MLVQTTVYATGKGQHQHLTLADGSVVELNAESRLSVRFSGSKREATAFWAFIVSATRSSKR